MWFATQELAGNDPDSWDDAISRARALGGIDGVKDDPTRPGIAAHYREWRDRRSNRPPRQPKAKPAAKPDANVVRLGKHKVDVSGWSNSAKEQIAKALDDGEEQAEGLSDMPSQPEIIAPRDNQSDNRESNRENINRLRVKNNKRYTKPEFALDIVKHFADQFEEDDSFLDPCFGEGAFAHAIDEVLGDENCDWCEIDPDTDIVKGYTTPRDFLDYDPEFEGHGRHVNWAITNPPWSPDEYRPIFRHALEIAENIVFLIRLENAVYSARRKEWEAAGFGLKEIAICRWQDAGFTSEGKELVALHWQRGYKGDTHNSKIEAAGHRLERYKGMIEEIALHVDKLNFDQRQILHGGLIQAAAMAIGIDPNHIFDAIRGIAAAYGKKPPPIPEAADISPEPRSVSSASAEPEDYFARIKEWTRSAEPAKETAD